MHNIVYLCHKNQRNTSTVIIFSLVEYAVIIAQRDIRLFIKLKLGHIVGKLGLDENIMTEKLFKPFTE